MNAAFHLPLHAQEYLDGEEWVVDTVSRAGEHKVLALWRYDKGEANGAPFVYRGIDAMAHSGERATRIAAYAAKVLDALEWRHGPVHMEVMWMGEERGPVLIEANAGRFNGEEFKLVADLCFGCNSYDAYFAACLDREDDAWQAVPPVPPSELRAVGKLVKLVSSVRGTLEAVQHLETVYELPSLVRLKLEASEEGEYVELTTDLNSNAGDAILIHEDAEVVEADYHTLLQLQPTLFEVKGQAVGAEDQQASGSHYEWLPPAERLRFEVDEAMRIVEFIRHRVDHQSAEGTRSTSSDGSTSNGETTSSSLTLSARFPLVDGVFEMVVPSACAVARSSILSSDPRKLGEALLRALRTAQTEDEAVRQFEDLVT